MSIVVLINSVKLRWEGHMIKTNYDIAEDDRLIKISKEITGDIG